ncbi:hypothetical protein IQ06DRAFT_380387 [Lecanosticta acicola]|uniref:Uncharacterized protein n=1 Tax=Lecanosticta acicola TaxID=111012 RepID=A0AAI8YV98_9PEZI|nr:hypothetical protein IQ06DRAFT_380387 [Lecanosticta acicola]
MAEQLLCDTGLLLTLAYLFQLHYVSEMPSTWSSTMSEALTLTKSDPKCESNRSWLDGLQSLSSAWPAIKGFLERTQDTAPRKTVKEQTWKRFGRIPGRCALLTFQEKHVEEQAFQSPDDLAKYLDANPTQQNSGLCRLWILEDLDLRWVEVLGSRLRVDPLVFSEQTNTFNFTVTRALPSLVRPIKAFTLRYFEFRQLRDENSIQTHTNQTTFALNARRIERWRDIDSPNFKCKWRHSLARRCASFWTNEKKGISGWDAVMLVDPAFDSFPHEGTHVPEVCTILQDPTTHNRLDALWTARNKGMMVPTKDTSVAYHGGSHTFTESTLDLDTARARQLVDEGRKLSSPLDEVVLHWTRVADPELISEARTHSVNSVHYLLKYIANLWVHQLDLVQSTIAQSEYFSEDYQASVDINTTSEEWRKKLREVLRATADINSLRRQMMHFDHHLTLNLERLGIILGAESIDPAAPNAIREAQMDFIHIHTRLRPFIARAMALDKTANELANLHANFKSIQYSELGLALSVFASVVFPATLVSSMLSMGNDYLPGQGRFWVFWAISVPVVFLVAMSLVFSRYLKTYFKAKIGQVFKKAA